MCCGPLPGDLLKKYNNTEISADLLEEQASQSSVKVFADRSKAKAKPQKRETVELPSTIPMNERKWIEIEPEESSLSEYEISKKVINLPRHSQTVQREDDGAVQFWRIKEHLQSQFPQILHWSDNRWKACLAAGGGSKRRFQYCTDDSGTIVHFRALQGHSGRSLIDPSLQDNVIIQSGPHASKNRTVRAGEEPEEHKRECLDGRSRITSKELAPIHSVKSGTLQNACSTKPRVVADLRKSALMHIVRLMNNRQKGLKRIMTQVQ